MDVQAATKDHAEVSNAVVLEYDGSCFGWCKTIKVLQPIREQATEQHNDYLR